MTERRESARERQREQEAEKHLDTQAGHPKLLQQLSQVAVVALGLGLITRVHLAHLATSAMHAASGAGRWIFQMRNCNP